MKDYDSYDHMPITAVEIPYKPPKKERERDRDRDRERERDRDYNVYILYYIFIY